MDLVTRNLLSNFKMGYGFGEDVEESIVFEHFINHCVVSNEYLEDFNLDDIHVGGENDLQIDGIGIVVNGLIINSKDEITDLLKTNKYIDAKFVFIQSKTGKNFSGSDISSMFFGIRELFAEKSVMKKNRELEQKEEILKFIYEKSAYFKRGLPELKIYYVTTGKWNADRTLLSRIEIERKQMLDMNIFAECCFVPLGSREIIKKYQRAQNTLQQTIEFKSRITIPAMPAINSAYLGYLPVKEYLKLVLDENKNLLRGLFYDNVRDYQQNNPVNDEIEQTLSCEDKQYFLLLNNGVTIVADSLILSGDNFTLSGYQIVNGCQTTHVLIKLMEIDFESVHIPVKLIVEPDPILKNKVIKATNRQTVVKMEELSALTDFQKELEEYYKAIPEDYRLYYERRSQQLQSVAGLEKIRIVSIPSQIRAFASMFLDKAHRASRYYGTLLKDLKQNIFAENHSKLGYYLSAYSLFKIDFYLRREKIDIKYRPFKYHILGIFRMIVCGPIRPNMNSNKFDKYLEPLKEVLWEDRKCLVNIKKTCKLLDTILDPDYHRDRAKDANILIEARRILKSRK